MDLFVVGSNESNKKRSFMLDMNRNKYFLDKGDGKISNIEISPLSATEILYEHWEHEPISGIFVAIMSKGYFNDVLNVANAIWEEFAVIYPNKKERFIYVVERLLNGLLDVKLK